MKKLSALLLALFCVRPTVLPVSANAPHYAPGETGPLPAVGRLMIFCIVVLCAIVLYFLLRNRRK